ncbi:MAG: hypothetical protein QME81_07145 [bacterium]|nr:hypothetical protein [bacterium]
MIKKVVLIIIIFLLVRVCSAKAQSHPEIGDIRTGFIDRDVEPLKGRVTLWDWSGGFAFDYLSRSIGIDLGNRGVVKKIALIKNDRRETRLKKSDLSIYLSPDNITYTKYPREFDYSDTLEVVEGQVVRVLSLDNLFIQTRYLKIHQTCSDKEFTFANRLPEMVRVYGYVFPEMDEIKIGGLDGDTSPLTGRITHWDHKGGFAFDYLSRSIGVDLGANGVIKKVVLIKNDHGETRLKKSDLSIYLSPDNITYTRYAREFDYSDTMEAVDDKPARILSLDNLFIRTRYLKIHQAHSDKEYTFVNRLPNIIKVYAHISSDVWEIKIGTFDLDTAYILGLIDNEQGFSSDYAVQRLGIDLGSSPAAEKEESVPGLKTVEPPIVKDVKVIDRRQPIRNYGKLFVDIGRRWEDNITHQPKGSGVIKDETVNEISLRYDLKRDLSPRIKQMSTYRFNFLKHQENTSLNSLQQEITISLSRPLWRLYPYFEVNTKWGSKPNKYFQTTINLNARYNLRKLLLGGGYFWRGIDYKEDVWSQPRDWTAHNIMFQSGYRIFESTNLELRFQYQPLRYEKLRAKDAYWEPINSKKREDDNYSTLLILSQDISRKFHGRLQGMYTLLLNESNSLPEEYGGHRLTLNLSSFLTEKIALSSYNYREWRNYPTRTIGNRQQMTSRLDYLYLKLQYNLRKWITPELSYTLIKNDSNIPTSCYLDHKYSFSLIMNYSL